MDALKIEIGKGTKEMRALQLMIQTYTNTPQVENPRALIQSCWCVFKNCRFVFFSLATQPNSNQSLTQWRPEYRNRRRNSRLCRWNHFFAFYLRKFFVWVFQRVYRPARSVKVKFKKWKDIYNYLYLQRNLDLVESKMSLNCGGSLLGARYVHV